MGYIWDIAKALLVAFTIIFVWNLVSETGDMHQNIPELYWGIWGIALIAGIKAAVGRYKRSKRREAIEEWQYQQAKAANEEENVG